ncbi:hypothetical protein N7481_004834 [Penicillium waksmanii]|uniref:uncharacterized protein n=1 Tax=Penicillium waksmanii TaxID=69791 RepID=UPI0025484595|nr:uncharacterized protein N7481_004834 [Penicillium waksmanii]KAJ5989624.1 hypothetical protein N7481_004834 [Penicillium waksmanii]
MVLLRLEVRVFPKEPAPTLSPERGGPNTSVFSRLIGNGVGNRNKEPEQNVDRTDSYELGEANPAKQYASFLLLLRNSDDLTLADLARRICDEWTTFRSDQEPLEIKKLLDDANPTVDLSLSMTVADVFLDVGKAFSDGHDQRAIVRVIQKPARHAPQRFSSVVQDWDGAVNKGFNHNNSRVGNQFSPIAEEGYAPASAQKSPAGQRPHDAPLPSIEIQSKYHRDQAIPGTPPIRSSGSEELGDSPSPEQGRRSKKRKPSLEENGPVKQRRVGEDRLEATEASATSPQRKRVNVPTFASPHRRASLSERPAANNSIGLGVTKSPLFKKPAKPDTPSSQNPGPMSTPSNAPTPSGSMVPPSAMRKSSPASIQSEKRRSISFNKQPILNSQSTPQASSSKAKTPRTKTPKPADKNSASGSKESSNFPPSSNTSTPMTQEEREQEEREKQFARIQKEVMEKISLKKKLKDPTTKPKVLSIVQEMLDIFAQVDDRKNRGEDQSTRPINRLKRKLSPLRKRLIAAEAEPTTDARETETSEFQEEEPETEAEPDARVTRSMTFTPTAPTNSSQAPTWSFNNVASSSTQKPVTRRESQSPRRRGSRSSATGSQTSPPKQSPTIRPSRSPSVVLYKSPETRISVWICQQQGSH